MKQFSVKLAATFLWDITDITLYILEKSGSHEVPRRFYNDTYWRQSTRGHLVQIAMSHTTRIRGRLNIGDYTSGIIQFFMLLMIPIWMCGGFYGPDPRLLRNCKKRKCAIPFEQEQLSALGRRLL